MNSASFKLNDDLIFHIVNRKKLLINATKTAIILYDTDILVYRYF